MEMEDGKNNSTKKLNLNSSETDIMENINELEPMVSEDSDSVFVSEFGGFTSKEDTLVFVPKCG